MRKSVKLKRKTKRLLIKNLIVFTVLIAVAAIGVRSWFIATPRAYAQDFSVIAQVPDGLEIQIVAPEGTTTASGWKSGTVQLNATNYSFLSGLNLEPVTGDGKTFIRPPLQQSSSVANVNASVQWDTTSDTYKTQPNREFISFDLYMRCKAENKKTVLKTTTYYGPVDETEGFGSLVAGWSANSVIGACRMAVYDFSENASTHALTNNLKNNKLLWIPAPQLYFDGINLRSEFDNPVTQQDNTLGLKYMDQDNAWHDIHTDGTYRHGYYYTSGSGSSQQRLRKILTPISGDSKTGTTYLSTMQASYNSSSKYMLPTQVDLANLNISNNDNGSYQMNKVRVNLWIEGEDPESRAAQVSGEFKCVLDIGLANSTG